SAYEEHMGTLDALGSCIWDAPDSDVSVEDVTDWVRDRAKEGRRIIAVDPITAADSGKEPWNTDRKFVVDAKRIMRDHNASLIVVTHPRDGSNQKQSSHLDNMAGGRAYNRFTTAVIWMKAIDDKTVRCRDFHSSMALSVTVNRELIISKTRNGRGSGWRIGFYFDPATLCF